MNQIKTIKSIEQQWRDSLPRFSDREVIEWFPEAKDIVPQKIGEWRTELTFLGRQIKAKLSLIRRKSAPKNQWFWREWVKVSDGPRLLEIDRHIARLRRLQNAMDGITRKGRIDDSMIARARSVPVESLIDRWFRKSGGKLIGLCPLHPDKSPSFVVYPATNTCWCFGCQRGGDAIRLTMQLNSLGFKDAVMLLANR